MPTGWAEADAVHYEGARLEAAFRKLFYRGLPRKQEALAAALAQDAQQDAQSAPMATPAVAAGPTTAPTTTSTTRVPSKHEYEIVVCHMNVIRFFVLRALQLPPECWLRMGGFNGSITHLRIVTDGRVCLDAFGDAGHLSLAETTFGSSRGWE
jgi:broad specificity phosphatase PhoE